MLRSPVRFGTVALASITALATPGNTTAAGHELRARVLVATNVFQVTTQLRQLLTPPPLYGPLLE
jgi:hypothetical protein